jgi:hypothetical protein
MPGGIWAKYGKQYSKAMASSSVEAPGRSFLGVYFWRVCYQAESVLHTKGGGCLETPI